MLCDAQAQQRTIYGPDGKVTGRVTTNSQGSTTIYDANGRTSTDSQGPTTLYGADRRKAGSRRAEGNDAYGMDATCRRRRCADNNAADGGRTMTIHRTQPTAPSALTVANFNGTASLT